MINFLNLEQIKSRPNPRCRSILKVECSCGQVNASPTLSVIHSSVVTCINCAISVCICALRWIYVAIIVCINISYCRQLINTKRNIRYCGLILNCAAVYWWHQHELTGSHVEILWTNCRKHRSRSCQTKGLRRLARDWYWVRHLQSLSCQACKS
jgi:hypothetical protein